MNPGKRFERKFAESMPGWVMRIPDKMNVYNGVVIGEETEADYLAVSGDHAYLIECKAVNRPRLEYYNVKEHQERSLAEFDAQGDHMHGLLAVEFYDKGGYRLPKRMFLLPIGEWLHFRAEAERSSMPIKAFEELGTECPYVKRRYEIDLGRIRW